MTLRYVATRHRSMFQRSTWIATRSYTQSIVGLSRKKLSRALLPYSVTLRSAGMTDSTEQRYRHHSRKQLLERIQALEGASKESDAPSGSASQSSVAPNGQDKLAAKQARPFDISRYPCRKIALRVAYDGEAYSGLEMQSVSGSSNGTPIETIESVIWQALADARLVDPTQTLSDVGWSRCGRTDRGVSAAGQVIALWVRSKKVDQWKERRAAEKVLERNTAADEESEEQGTSEPSSRADWYTSARRRLQAFMAEEDGVTAGDSVRTDLIRPQPDAEELPYVMSLNRLLPPTIQVQAWSPVDPLFNARFDCKYRHYKYFFTEGSPFVREPSVYGPQPRLRIDLMRQAAQRFLGEHDFRNFCKIDASKQMDNFYRRIDGVSIDPVDDSWRIKAPKARQLSHEGEVENAERMWVLNLRGTAFLYHQVRNIVAVLFLVGAGLEKPDVVDELLNVRPNGVYTDRLVAGLANGLFLKEEEIQTTLPPATHRPAGASDLTQTYQQLRRKAEQHADVGLGLSEEQAHSLAPLKQLAIYDRKPVFEMALDRPLMLWECGFRDEDVQWRAGTYDGVLQAASANAAAISGPSQVSRALMHATWSAQTVSAEIYRHLTLALASDRIDDERVQPGYIPASTDFLTASFPALESGLIDGIEKAEEQFVRDFVPLGYGRFKTMPTYAPLRTVARQMTPDEKNEKWKTTKGQKRTAKLQAKQAAVDGVST